jgi:phosphoserine phosphatase RsbU/P
VRGAGKIIRSLFDYGEVARTIQFGEPWTLVIARDVGGGKWREQRLSVPPMLASDPDFDAWLLIIALGVALPLLTITTAIFIGLLKPEDNNAFLASLLFLSFSTIFGVQYKTFPVGVREFALLWQTTLNTFVGYLFALFFLRFPSPSLLDRKAPWLNRLLLGLTIIVWLVSLATTWFEYTSFDQAQRLGNALTGFGKVFNLIVLLLFIVGLSSLLLNTVRAETKDEKRRMLILLAGAMVGLLPLVISSIFFPAEDRPPSLWRILMLGATLGIFPLSFVYVVVKHRVLGIRVILRRGLQYALVSRGFLVVEGFLIFVAIFFGARPLFVKLVPNAGMSAVAVSTAVLTIGLLSGLRRINRRVMPTIDRRFFRETYNAHQILSELSHTVRRLAAQPEKLLETVTNKLSDSLYPNQVAIFLRGIEMTFLPADGNQLAISSIKLAAPTADRFRCYGFRSHSRDGNETLHTPETYARLAFPAKAFIPRYLERAVAGEPATVEVWQDDPHWWTNTLSRMDMQKDALFQERRLLEQLHTRLIVPLSTTERLLGFISLGEKLSEEPYSKEDKELLLAVAQQTAIALDYAQLISQVAEQEKLKHEIEFAKEVQAELFPQTLPHLKTLDYSGSCRPASGVGGDYYDFLLLAADQLGIALGDISGKGVSAALLMASLQALLRSQAPAYGNRVDELISEINRLMHASTGSSKYATFFYGLYDDTQRTLTYVNAGHNAPMLFRPTEIAASRLDALGALGYSDGAPHAPALQQTGACEVTRMETGGLAVGLFGKSVYQQETVQLRPGDLLLLFTDGVSEAMNADEAEFGEARLTELVAAHRQLPAVALRELILAEIARFAAGAPQYDDLTLIVAKVV